MKIMKIMKIMKASSISVHPIHLPLHHFRAVAEQLPEEVGNISAQRDQRTHSYAPDQDEANKDLGVSENVG